MLKNWSLVVFGMVLSTFGVTMAAAQPQLSATLSAPKVRPGESVELTISVKTEEEVNVEQPDWVVPPGVLNQGVQTRSSMQSRLIPGPNGMQFEKNRSIDFVYQLGPTREGKFKLGPFKVTVADQTFDVAAVAFEVTPSAPAPPKERQAPGGLFPPGLFDEEDEQLFGQLLRRQRPQQEQDIPSRTLPINDKEAFFVIVEVDKKEAFEGEQIFASWYIYTRGNIHQFDRLKFPALRGFWKEDVEPAPNLNFEREMVNGVLFHRALLASYAIFPIKAGKAVIDEYKIRALVSLPTASFGGFGFGQPYSYTRTSTPQQITIKPLPVEGRPDNFSGAVGNFRVEAHVDNQSFVQGQPFTLKLRFDGDGNAKLIELPKMNWPESFELYDTKSESRFFQSGKSYKEFTMLVIPKASGVLHLPPLEFSYFDPVSATYKSTSTQEIALQVAPGTNQVGASERMKLESQAKSEESAVVPAPAPRMTEASWRWLSGLPMLFVWTALYLVLFTAFLLGHWLWLKRLYRGRSLMEELLLRKQKWEDAIKKQQYSLAATEVINAIYFVLSRLVDQGGLSKDLAYLLDQLPPSIRGEVADPLRKELDVLQSVAFAPKEAWKRLADAAELRKLTEETYQILHKALKLAEEGSVI